MRFQNIAEFQSIIDVHKPLWDKLKKERWKIGENGSGSLTSIPEFADSLRLLLVDQGYSFTDVGTMFGVSRERVRQWAGALGIQKRHGQGSDMRVWDRKAGRFRTVGSVKNYRREAYRRKYGNRIHSTKTLAMRKRRQEILQIARELGIVPNSPPLAVDIVAALFPHLSHPHGNISRIARPFFRPNNRRQYRGWYQQAIDTLYLMAGYSWRPGPGYRQRRILERRL